MFKKKEIFKVKSVPLDPTAISNPVTAADYSKRGMAHYARKQFELAEKDFREAIALDGKLADAYYTLGMVYKATGRKDAAIQAFNHVIELVAEDAASGKPSAAMLRRLALGHVNEISLGDWNLEKEIWKRIP